MSKETLLEQYQKESYLLARGLFSTTEAAQCLEQFMQLRTSGTYPLDHKAQPGTCMAFWVALEAADEENGCLQVVPGSHRLPMLCTQKAYTTLSFTVVAVPVPEGLESVSVPVQTGDALFFNGSLIHGSPPNTSSTRFRRAITGHYVGAGARAGGQVLPPRHDHVGWVGMAGDKRGGRPLWGVGGPPGEAGGRDPAGLGVVARGPEDQGVTLKPSPSKAILVIDDQPIARSTLRRQLEYYGFAVLEEATAIAGLRTYHKERARIGLVFLDLDLPDLSGEETFARLRKLNPQAKVALCSEESATQIKGQKGFHGALGVIKKPVRTDRLLAVVRHALG